MEKDTTQFTKSEHTAARRHSLGNILVYLLLTIWALVVLFPFYWMLLTSVKSYSSYNAEHIPTFFTLTPTLQNYADAFTAVPLGKYLLNTLIFTVATTAIMMVVITLSAFAFARLFGGKTPGVQRAKFCRAQPLIKAAPCTQGAMFCVPGIWRHPFGAAFLALRTDKSRRSACALLLVPNQRYSISSRLGPVEIM